MTQINSHQDKALPKVLRQSLIISPFQYLQPAWRYSITLTSFYFHLFDIYISTLLDNSSPQQGMIMNINKLLTFKQLAIFLGLILLIGNPVMATQKKPCTQPEYRQFDFWIGDWVVKNNKGVVVGSNKIFPILNGCALSENWVSAKGNPGVSYNFYDAAEKKWHQTWVDSSGGALYLDGGLVDGKMILKGSRPGKNSVTSIQKITWTPLDDGRVKQHWQSSNDNEKSWSDVFVGYYSKRD